MHPLVARDPTTGRSQHLPSRHHRFHLTLALIAAGALPLAWAGALYLLAHRTTESGITRDLRAAAFNVRTVTWNIALLSGRLKDSIPATVAEIGGTARSLRLTSDRIGKTADAATKTLRAANDGLPDIFATAHDAMVGVGNLVTEAREGIKPALSHLDEPIINLGRITADISKSTPLLFDCHDPVGKATCLPPRIAGTLRALELVSGQVEIASKQFPELIMTFQSTNRELGGIASDFHGMTADGRRVADAFTANYFRPLHWYEHVIRAVPYASTGWEAWSGYKIWKEMNLRTGK